MGNPEMIRPNIKYIYGCYFKDEQNFILFFYFYLQLIKILETNTNLFC